MKNIGFVSSKKENENRIAITFDDVLKIKNKNKLFFEKNYFVKFGINDDELLKIGCNVVDRNDVLKCNIICDPKIGDAEYLDCLNNQILFGWIHATQNEEITQKIINGQNTAFAWEKMFDEKKHIFWRNNQIAGEAAVLDALLKYGKLPTNLSVSILGNGNTSTGAQRIFNALKAKISVYGRSLEEKFKKEFINSDIIVNAVLWDTNRKDHVIYKDDLKKMKRDALIIDISCDHNGAIETCHPTTIDNPTYYIDGIMHYAVDHTPTLLYKDASASISHEVLNYIDLFIEEKEETSKILSNALIIENGKILDQEIINYQNRM